MKADVASGPDRRTEWGRWRSRVGATRASTCTQVSLYLSTGTTSAPPAPPGLSDAHRPPEFCVTRAAREAGRMDHNQADFLKSLIGLLNFLCWVCCVASKCVCCVTGVRCVRGVTGVRCVRCVTGVRCVPGVTGVRGVRGVTGVRGVRGVTGVRAVTVVLRVQVCAVFVVGFGEFQRMNSLFGAVVPGFLPIYPSNTLIVTGTIACCVCYVGVLGAMKENRCMLIMFFLLLFILILVELAMGILFMVYVTKLDSYLKSDLMGSLEALRTAQPDTNKTLRDEFDAVHYLFQCCGVRGEDDWEGNAPVSCCSQEECDSAPYDTWSEGCLQKLRNWFSHNFRSTGAGVIALAILKLVCMCVTVPLLILLRRNRLGYI
ncbi:unnamed protein product [Boreogadus saida]